MEEHYQTFKMFLNKSNVLLNKKELYTNDKLMLDFFTDFKDFFWNTIHTTLEPNRIINGRFTESEKYIRYYVKYIIVNILPLCHTKIAEYKPFIDDQDKLNILNGWIRLEDDYYALASMRSIKHFAYYIERGTRNKVWAKTMPIFEGYFYYVGKMILDGEMDIIRSSFFPGAGKTYSGNITCAFWFGIDEEISILRITFSDDLAKSFTKQIANIILSDNYKKVFPKYDLQEKDLFKVNNAGQIWFSFSNSVNFYATTRDGQTTGKRAKVLMIDDITKGAKEAYKVDVHKGITDQYDSDWCSRADDDNQKQIIMGTMWSPYDLLNVIQKRAEKEGQLKRDLKFQYTLVDSENPQSIRRAFISVPLLDYETDESTCPSRYSTEKARRKRDEYQDKSLFNAVYQQKPDAPEELIFDYKNIKTYTEQTFPKEILNGDYECRVMIDPNRKAFDYFCALFFKRYAIDKDNDIYSKWYLVDLVFKRKQYKDLIDKVCEKIKYHNVSKVTMEINTSNDMAQLTEEHLEKIDYYDVDIEEIFSTEKKEEKIAQAEAGIKSELVFPDKYMYSESSEMGSGMVQFTTYDADGNNKHDDFPDCVAMFVKYNCEKELSNQMEVLDSSFRL